MELININQFISEHITGRSESLLSQDIQSHKDRLTEAIQDKSVLVIGGGGTIGSSYIRAILAYRPKSLYVVDTDENRLTELTRRLRSKAGAYVPDDYKTYPMSYRSEVFHKMLERVGPFDIVAHFAAHKHVRSEKDQFSIEAMLKNNLYGTVELIETLVKNPPERFFCVSTDKAAHPVNVMGASKKLMEEAIMAYADDMCISTARFANVAFSNGSLLDGYLYRLRERQPISCPEDVRRFFVSPDESGELCMIAGILGRPGDIFFPKLEVDDLILFKDITERFFHAMGMKTDICVSEEEAREKASQWSYGKDYPVFYFKTNTSGEKLYEEFYIDTDELDLDRFSQLGVITNAVRPSKEAVQATLSDMMTVMNRPAYTKADIVAAMKKHLEGFDHIETGQSLDNRM